MRQLVLCFVALLPLVTISAFESDSGECCPCTNASKTEEKDLEFSEGENVTINVIGDKNGDGCKFVFQQKKQNATCCYIHRFRKRERLCGSSTQPETCRKQEEYDVKEIDGHIGECTLTLFDAKLSDSGDYDIIFPVDTRYNTARTVTVLKLVKTGLNWWQVLLIVLFVIFALLLFVIIPIYLCLLRPRLKERDQRKRNHDEVILKLLMETKIEELKKKLELKKESNKSHEEILKLKDEELKRKLGKRNILGLRDRNYNNIFHLAAGADWNEEMTKIVIKIKLGNQDSEAGNQDSESLINKKIFNLASTNRISNIFPDYSVPNCMLHMNISLNTRNLEGNTPLMIASKENQLEVVKVLLEKNVKHNMKNNDRYTALHQAVMKKNAKVVSLLLNKKAHQETSSENGKTPLHTAIERKSQEIVELLVENKKKRKTNCNPLVRDSFRIKMQNRKKAKEKEPPLHLAVQLGFLDISRYLKSEEYDDWHAIDKDEKSTVYDLVAAGHKEVITFLIKECNLNWAQFHKSCLVEAIEEKNRQAVNNIYSLIPGQTPSEQDRVIALGKAQQKLSELQKKEDIAKIKRIIEKLEKEGAILILDQAITIPGHNHERAIPKHDQEIAPVVSEDNDLSILKKKLKEEEEKYFVYIRELKQKTNGEIWKDLEEITKFHLGFNEKISPIRVEIYKLSTYQQCHQEFDKEVNPIRVELNKTAQAVIADNELLTLKKKLKEKKEKYSKYTTELKETTNGEIWKDLHYIAKFHQEFNKEVNQIRGAIDIKQINNIENKDNKCN